MFPGADGRWTPLKIRICYRLHAVPHRHKEKTTRVYVGQWDTQVGAQRSGTFHFHSTKCLSCKSIFTTRCSDQREIPVAREISLQGELCHCVCPVDPLGCTSFRQQRQCSRPFEVYVPLFICYPVIATALYDSTVKRKLHQKMKDESLLQK